MSGSECGGAEDVPPDYHRVEHEAEREIEDYADDHGGDVVLQSAFGNGRSPGIAAAFEGDPVIDGPGQHRSEQDDPTDIAIDQEMRHRPGLHADQHGMFEYTFDIARQIGRGDENAVGQQHGFGDMPGPG